MLEQDVQRKIIKYLEAKGAYVVKIISASKAGVPDLLVCYEGRFIGIEVKRPAKKTNASKLQVYNIELIQNALGLAGVAWDIESLERILDAV